MNGITHPPVRFGEPHRVPGITFANLMPVGCQEAKRLGESVQFGGLFAGALEDISGLNEELLFSFSKLLRLTLPQQLSLGLGLVQSVSSEATQQEGAKFLKSKLN